MDPQISSLKWLAVDSNADENCCNRRYSYNSIVRCFIKHSDHQGNQYFLKATEKPKIFSDRFVVGPDHIYWSTVGIVSHPFRLNGLLLYFEKQEHEKNEL